LYGMIEFTIVELRWVPYSKKMVRSLACTIKTYSLVSDLADGLAYYLWCKISQ